MSTSTLVLDQGYVPHRIVPWQRAVALIFGRRAEVVAEYDAEVGTVSLTFKIPSVIRLINAIPHKKRQVRFSRVNIATRDGFRCQYCNCKLSLSKLTYDHVLPRSHGGRTEWTNIVSACHDCNNKKRSLTPEKAGMKLKKKPIKPDWLPISAFHIEVGASIPDSWASYIYWNDELEHGS